MPGLYWLTPPQERTLRLLVKADGRAVRSNYTAEWITDGHWPLYWKSLEALHRAGLIYRIGRFYDLTEAGRHLIEQTAFRRL